MAGETPPARSRPDPRTAAEMTAAIRYCLAAGSVIPTKHFRDQSYQRNSTIQDAINVLESGEVSSDPPQWNERMRDWTYKVHGPDLEGDVLTVVVGIAPDRQTVWLVTAF